MTFGQLFTAMHPDVRAIENGSCVWLFMDEVNHYTIANEWWNQEVTGYALELLKEQEPVKPFVGNYWKNSMGRCGHCKAPLPALEGLRSKFCWMCGRKVKWDD